MKFRIYYGNGETYSGDPFHAPRVNVQAIAIEDPDASRGCKTITGKDAYYWKHGRWYGCDTPGMWDYLYFHDGPIAIIFGRTIRDDDYWRMVQRANKEGLG